MHRSCLIGFGLLLCGLFSGLVRAETFQLNDGKILEGEIILPATGEGLIIKTSPGQYPRVPWTSFTQSALRELVARNPELTRFAEPYLDVPEAEKIKKTEVVIKDVPRLERPARSSLLGALFRSSVGLVVLLLMYAANVYAGYEIAVFRAQPAALVCGTAAVLPLIGPIIFLSLPTRVKRQPLEENKTEGTASDAWSATTADDEHAHAGTKISPARPARTAAPLPEIQVFKRGQFTFNRRFFETKFPGFFGVIRRDAEKDMVLLIKSTHGEFVASRISRMAPNDMHVDAQKGAGTQEVRVPFAEIQEIQLKHKDA